MQRDVTPLPLALSMKPEGCWHSSGGAVVIKAEGFPVSDSLKPTNIFPKMLERLGIPGVAYIGPIECANIRISPF